MIGSLALSTKNAVKYALRYGQIKADEKIIEKRLSTCETCPYKMHGNRCKLCGCFIILKSGIISESCPDGRW
jgi:hypothetical protein